MAEPSLCVTCRTYRAYQHSGTKCAGQYWPPYLIKTCWWFWRRAQKFDPVKEDVFELDFPYISRRCFGCLFRFSASINRREGAGGSDAAPLVVFPSFVDPWLFWDHAYSVTWNNIVARIWKLQKRWDSKGLSVNMQTAVPTSYTCMYARSDGLIYCMCSAWTFTHIGHNTVHTAKKGLSKTQKWLFFLSKNS